MTPKELVEAARMGCYVHWKRKNVYARLAMDSYGRVVSVSAKSFKSVSLCEKYACKIVKKKEALVALSSGDEKS